MNHAEIEPGTFTTPGDLIARCAEEGVQAVLVPDGALPPAFFDLSSGLAGEIVQKLVNYGVRMAVVVPDLSVHSERFAEFAGEANRGRQFRFFRDHADAVAWLEGT